MRKILSLIITLVFGMQFCCAEGLANQSTSLQNNSVQSINAADASTQGANEEENIDSYFVEEPEQPIQLEGYLEYTPPSMEQEAVELDSANVAKINFTKPKNFSSKSLITKKPTFQPIQDDLRPASRFSSPEYNIKPVSTSYSKKFGRMSFGTMYNSGLDSAQMNYSTGVFTKYEGKHLAFSTAFSKNANSQFSSYSDKFYVVPEWKITKRLSLLDVMQTDVAQINKKNEVVLRYTPNFRRYADDVQFEIGAGQSFYDDAYLNSSIRFSTRFKI